MERVVYYNGFVPEKEALLPYNDLSIQRGYGVFDFFRVINSKAWHLDDHLERFYRSARELHLTVPVEKAALTGLIYELIQKNNYEKGGIKITLTGGPSPDGYQIGQPQLLINCQDFPDVSQHQLESGIRLLSYPYQRQLPHVKTIDYLMAVWLQPLCRQQQADDILYYQASGISECPRSNIFLVNREQTIATPADHILKGITRKYVLEKGSTIYKMEERSITLEEIKCSEEVFITSTTKLILPVTQIDGILIGKGRPGTITRKLRTLLSEELNG